VTPPPPSPVKAGLTNVIQNVVVVYPLVGVLVKRSGKISDVILYPHGLNVGNIRQICDVNVLGEPPTAP